ncbi:MAG TPA: secretin N-terminal domain-containing protein [Verrucomicrobiae bacterium]|nr:secretin N-terminal domain-containing protein [Verrucomicrobiae bacterium]
MSPTDQMIKPAPGTKDIAPEELLQPGMIDFRQADLNQVLELYADLVNRTILRGANLTAPPIVLKTQTPLTKSEAVEALDAVLALNNVAVINIGDKFAKAVPLNVANQMGAKFSTLDEAKLPDIGQYITHVVQLKYVKPSELVQVLQPFASSIPNAILPIDSSQILVLRDLTENVKRMLELIKEIDVSVPSEYISEVIPIKYALASDMQSALSSLGSGGSSATVGGGSRTGSNGTRGTSFGTHTGSFGSPSSGMGGYPGSTMGGGYPGVTPQATTAPTRSTGNSFTDRLRNLVQKASSAGEIQVLGETKIIADERTNSLLIFATREDMKMIKDIIAKLDVVLAQVLIEGVIIEVNLNDNSDLGFSYLQNPATSGKFVGVGSAGAGTFFTPEQFIVSGSSNAAGSLTGGFNYLGKWGNDLDVTVTALAGSSRAKILQRPRIQTSNAREATLFVGESRPYPTGSYYGGGAFGGYSSIQQVEIGVTLDVTPLINPDGLVVMDIHQTIESANGTVNIQNIGDVPITSRKEAQANVAVRDHDTIMLGGLIETQKQKSNSGVPYLKDVPIIGPLFRSTSDTEVRNELVVLIRPTVLPTPEVAAVTAKAEQRRMPEIRRAEHEIQEDENMRIKAADKALNQGPDQTNPEN